MENIKTKKNNKIKEGCMEKNNWFGRWIYSFILLSIGWLLFTFPFNQQELIVGLVAAFVISLFTANFFEDFGLKSFSPIKILGLIIYIPYILWEIFLANLQVAKIVLSPKLPINPAIVKAKTTLRSDFGKMLLANSITLTPGTLTLEVDGDYFYIHCLKIDDTSEENATKTITAKFEKHLRRFVI